jgi:hypothetical protein
MLVQRQQGSYSITTLSSEDEGRFHHGSRIIEAKATSCGKNAWDTDCSRKRHDPEEEIITLPGSASLGRLACDDSDMKNTSKG